MKFASLRSSQSRHGIPVLVSQDLKSAINLAEVLPVRSLLEVIEQWDHLLPQLEELNRLFQRDKATLIFRFEDCIAPLPYTYGFYDGSAFLSHVERARKARGDIMPESARRVPLMYQGVSDAMLAWNDPIRLGKEEFGGDFEGEFAVVTKDLKKNATASEVESACILYGLFNDVTLREIVKVELETKFGFLQSKPNSAFAPILVTSDELGNSLRAGRIELDCEVKWNGDWLGNPNGREMHFSFFELVAHANRTRPLSAGSIIGTGTVSNQSEERGVACLTEKRFLELIHRKEVNTRWLKSGDVVQIETKIQGKTVFGPIHQSVVL